MAEKIKGFTIELDLDSIKVDSGLRDVKQSMRLVNSEMKNNMSAFDRSEKSVEKYSTQLSGLNKKYEAQEVVVDNARKRHEKMVEQYGENSRQAEKAATAYNNEMAQLKNLGRYIDDVTVEMNEFKRVQEIQSTSLWKTGDALEGFGSGLSDVSEKAKQTGWSLTKKLTLPALAVAGAVGGIVASFGWGRLVGIDNAQAQLEGLGYSTEDVGRISEQVTDAIEGGMTTMAEGTAIAAGAMAAGVEEGKELEKYIKLVGDAAVGSNRPVDEMAQIFNRVQGSGKLMTQELNMIEQGMPGFAQAMADEVADGSLEAFRDMVTAGEVGSDEFLEVMDDFAGGMAEAYSGTWEGMVKNTKAYVGIIGENLLSGVFEESKESIAEFIEILKSDDIQEWATDMGEKLGNAFTKVVDTVKDVVKWFRDLDGSKQRLILGLGGFVVALGPILIGLGTLGGIIGTVSSGLGTFFKFLAPLLVPLKALGGAASASAGSVGLIGKVMAVISNPVTITIAVITALAGAFVFAYKKSETFRDFIGKLGTKIKEMFQNFKDWITPAIDAVIDFIDEIKEKFTDFQNEEGAQIQEAFMNIWKVISSVSGWIADKVSWAFGIVSDIVEFLMPFLEGMISTAWSGIKSVITGALDVIMGAIKIFSGLFTGDWEKMWEGLVDMIGGFIEMIWGAIKFSFFGQIIGGIIDFVADFIENFTEMWEDTKELFIEKALDLYEWFEESFIGKFILGIIDFAFNFQENISDMWDTIKEVFFEKGEEVYESLIESFIGRIILGIIEFALDFRKNISSMWTLAKATFIEKITEIYNNLKESFIGRIITSIINFVLNFKKNISNMWTSLKNNFRNKIMEIYNNLKNSFVGKIIISIINFAIDFRKNISNMWTQTKGLFSSKINEIRSSIANSFVGRMLSSIRTLKTNFVNIAKEMWQGVKKQFGNIVDGAKALPGKIGRGIKGAKSKATDGMKNVGNSVIKWAGKPFNKVVDGVNWVTGKLGVKTKIGKWDYPQYAKGTSGHPGGMAVVGDKYGRELVNLPDGRSFISPDTDTMLNLPKGTQVIPNKQTEQMLDFDIPHYAKGTGGWFSSMKESIGEVWDYIKNPSKIVSKMIDKISILGATGQIPKKIVKSGFNYVKDKPTQFIKDMFKKQEETEHNPNYGAGGKPAFGWPVTSNFGIRRHPIYGTARLHAGTDFGAPQGAPVPSTTGGSVSFAGRMGGFGNLVKVKQGIWEMYYAHLSKIMTSVGKTIKKGDILGLVGSTGDSTGPHLHYETRKNGVPKDPMGLKGFKTGGVIKSKMMAMLGEEGEEIVIPTAKNRRTDAMKLLALAAKKIGADGGSYSRPGNIPSPAGGNNEQIELLREQNNILMQLLQKDNNVYLDGDDITKNVNNKNAIDTIGRYF